MNENDVALARLTNNVGNALLLLGNYEAAEKTKLKSLEMFKAASGEKSPYTAQVLGELGTLYFQFEKYDQSERSYARPLALMTELLGPEHATTLVHRRSHANALSFLGKDPEAEPILKDVIAASERTLGSMHADILAAVNSLATMDLRSDRDAEAEPLLRSLVERSSKSLGETHAETLKYACSLAWCETHLKKAEEAERHFRMAVDGFRSTLGDTHPDAIGSQDGYAQFLGKQKRWTEAAAADKNVLDWSAAAGQPEDMARRGFSAAWAPT